MNMQNAFALSIDNEAFSSMKSDFNQVLKKTLSNMEKRETEVAEMTIKLKITLFRGETTDFSAISYGKKRDIVIPAFTHKVSSVMQIKDEKSGIFSGNFELVWDEETSDYIIKVIPNGQRTLFDCDDEDENEEDE
jgi:hypothetical protein